MQYCNCLNKFSTVKNKIVGQVSLKLVCRFPIKFYFSIYFTASYNLPHISVRIYIGKIQSRSKWKCERYILAKSYTLRIIFLHDTTKPRSK